MLLDLTHFQSPAGFRPCFRLYKTSAWSALLLSLRRIDMLCSYFSYDQYKGIQKELQAGSSSFSSLFASISFLARSWKFASVKTSMARSSAAWQSHLFLALYSLAVFFQSGCSLFFIRSVWLTETEHSRGIFLAFRLEVPAVFLYNIRIIKEGSLSRDQV